VRQQRVARLLCQRPRVQRVAHQAEREDGHGQRVASAVRAAAEQPRQGLVVVFCAQAVSGSGSA
jgi:hypothetical protein